jgi:hypothetical protein
MPAGTLLPVTPTFQSAITGFGKLFFAPVWQLAQFELNPVWFVDVTPAAVWQFKQFVIWPAGWE